MSSDPIQGEPRRRLITVTRRRVALAAAALLGALWLAFVGRVESGDDPVLKEGPSEASAGATETKTETTPTETKTETTGTETTGTETKTETTGTETSQTETTQTETTEEETSTSTTEQS